MAAYCVYLGLSPDPARINVHSAPGRCNGDPNSQALQSCLRHCLRCCAPTPVAQPSHPDTFCNILESIGLDTAKLSNFFDVLAMTL